MPRKVWGLWLSIGVLLASAAPAAAASVTVTTTLDNGNGTCTPSACTLRDAVADASADTIVVPAGHYTAADIDVNHPVTIQGAGASTTVLDAAHGGRVFAIHTGFGTTITISGVEITGGAGHYPGGGAIIADAGASLTLTNDLVDNNQQTLGGYSTNDLGGGAIRLDAGTLTLTNTTVSHNKLTITTLGGSYDGGGAIFAPHLIATGSHIDSNTLTFTGPASDANAGCCSGGGGVWTNASQDHTISNTTIDGNTVTVNSGGCCFGGGGLFVGGSAGAFTTTLTDSTVDGNSVTVSGPSTTTMDDIHCCSGGGGIYAGSGLVVVGGAISNNTASITAGDCCHGGAGALMVADRQPSSFTDAEIEGNKLTVSGSGADSGGGGIYDGINTARAMPFATRLTIDSSTLAANGASILGGATNSGGGAMFLLLDGENSIANSTLSDNTTTGQGGGAIFAEKQTGQPSRLTLASATIAGNSAPAGSGGAVVDEGLPTEAENSILALNTAATSSECSGFAGATFGSLGYNLTDSPNTCSLTGPGDLTVPSASVGIGALADNGGPTKTRALAATSPAVNAANPAGCDDPAGSPLSTDQRGLMRTFGGRCDIGAFELQQSVGPPSGGTPVSPSTGFSFALTSGDGGIVTTTIAARGSGHFAVKANFTINGAHPQKFDHHSTDALTPGAVVVELRPSSAARAALASHQHLRVTVAVNFASAAGGASHATKSISVTLPRQPVHRGPSIPSVLEVESSTTLQIVSNGPTTFPSFTGTLSYTNATDAFGHAIPAPLAMLARQRCLATFDAGGGGGNGGHVAAQAYEQDAPGLPTGELLRLTTMGATHLLGSGRWSRLMFPGDRLKEVTYVIGGMDRFENYLTGSETRFKYKGHAVEAHCVGAIVAKPWTGPVFAQH